MRQWIIGLSWMLALPLFAADTAAPTPPVKATAPPGTPVQPPASSVPPAKAPPAEPAPSRPAERFEPSERVRADFEVSFPVDI